MTKVSAVFVGRSGSGKTTYLAALWSTLKNAANGSAPRLAGALPHNTQFLDEIEDALLSGRPVDRTRLDSGEDVRLAIALDDGLEVEIHYVDLAGESLGAVVMNRLAPDLLISRLATANATIFFMHPEDTQSMPMIGHPASPAVDLSDVDRGSAIEPSDEEIWDAAPSDVRHIELLQICREAAATDRLPTAIVVSAWDLVASPPNWEHPDPKAWLRTQLPLLTQYLEANEVRHPWRVFGVSAQGADNADDEAIRALLDSPCADRTVVSHDGSWTRSVASPIGWLREVIDDDG